jgi:hypothetical protein
VYVQVTYFVVSERLKLVPTTKTNTKMDTWILILFQLVRLHKSSTLIQERSTLVQKFVSSRTNIEKKMNGH